MTNSRSNPIHSLPSPFPDAAFDVVAMAASAGGLHALNQILAGLPGDFPAAIVIVQHLDPHHRSLMADILNRGTALRVKQAEANERLKPGTVYIAPPNYHLLVNADSTLTLTQTKLVNFVRPSADQLFESLANSYQDRAIAVVLTGTGRDGAKGICLIKAMGGTTLAQEVLSAKFSGMPSAAIETGKIDLILPLSEISKSLISLVAKPQ